MPAGESEAKAKTKAQFEEVLKSYSGLTVGKKKSKKSIPTQENIVLEKLRNKLSLQKDNEDDKTILNNTYNPEKQSPRFSKNKLNDRTSVAEKINNVEFFEDEIPAKNKKKKKKVGEHSFIEEVPRPDSVLIQQKSREKRSRSAYGKEYHTEIVKKNDIGEDVDTLIQAYQQAIAVKDAGGVKKKAKQVKAHSIKTFSRVSSKLAKKLDKMKTLKESASVEGEMSKMHLSELQDETDGREKNVPHRKLISEVEEIKNEEKEISKQEKKQQRPKRKRNKKIKKEEMEPKEEIMHEIAPELETAPQQQKPKYVTDDDLVLGVYIHRADLLKTDILTSHPSVKVHVIDEVSGQYVKKEHSSRPVTSYYEQENVEHILPIITQPYDFRKRKSAIPAWEEQIIFNERFGYFLHEFMDSPSSLLFFEILEFVSMDEAKANYATQSSEGGWRKIAWAFLKLVGANGVLNIDRKLRLQLYYPPVKVKKLSNSIDVFEWWKKRPWNQYPSTLYVTVKGLRLPQNVNPSVRSMMAIQREQGTISYSDLQTELVQGAVSSTLEYQKLDLLKWTRLPGQVCRIPNKLLLSFRGGQTGCYFIQFSHDGRSLAASCADRSGHFIMVYEIPSGHLLGEFNGHFNIVYSLCWSNDDKTILSASSDGTVRVWNTENYQSPAEKILPHPSFIYTAKYHPFVQCLVVTGGYDSIIRVWNINVNEVNGQLLQEFDGHKSFINTLCFDAEGLRMFSGDSTGLVIVWSTVVSESSPENLVQQWTIAENIMQNDLKGVPINHLEVHPNGRHLLIHARDSTLRMMDLRVLAAKKYTGATNYREQLYSTFTPCGMFLFSGSEDGICYVWNSETVAQMEAETMKEVCKASLKSGNTSTPKGPRILSGTFDSSTVYNGSFFSISHSSRISMKMQKVKQKLDTVVASVQQSTSEMDFANQGVVPMMPLDMISDSSFSSVGNHYYNSTRSNLLLPAPSLLSPHSKLRLPTTVGAHLLSQQSLTSQAGGFSPVGHRFGRAPSVKLEKTCEKTISSVKVEADSDAPVEETVVALYDYTANRSDELTIQRYDIIQVLYKDNASWWFGRLANGKQGYFPANYVANERIPEETEQHQQIISPMAVYKDGETEVKSPTPTQMSAVISKSGELKLISEHDTDTESPVKLTPQKKKKKKKKQKAAAQLLSETASTSNLIVTESEFKTDSGITRKKTKKAVKDHYTMGGINDAFEQD
ncbi:jouberin isoform X2 [Stegostoma tigrinum]|uniref:jouberin isoform X2 n=1 Tax=Stegostoma tigrinum TaxID=3053191 RepID=UPI00202B4D49|nr:jouberin isoform X2 [Stegostoma tigrinum]